MPATLCGLLAILLAALPAADQDTHRAGYLNHSSLTETLQELAAEHPSACRLVAIGTSRQGRKLWALELGRGEDRDRRTALAIVGGMDGDDPVGSPVALRVASGLLMAGPDEIGHKLLSEYTVYVLPRVKPRYLRSAEQA